MSQSRGVSATRGLTVLSLESIMINPYPHGSCTRVFIEYDIEQWVFQSVHKLQTVNHVDNAY